MRKFGFIVWQIYFWLFTAFVVLGGFLATFNLVDRIDWVLIILALIISGALSWKTMAIPKALDLFFWCMTVGFHYIYIFYLDFHYGATPAHGIGGILEGALPTLPLFIVWILQINGSLKPKF